MNRPDPGSRLDAFRTSIWVSCCSGFGFWMAYMDGADLHAFLVGALALSMVMIVYFGGLMLWRALRQRRRPPSKPNR